MVDLNLIAVSLGLFIGLLMGITGAGGAIVSLPLLMYLFDIGLKEAAPIALLATAVSAGLASIIGLRQGIVRYKAASLLAIMGVIMAPIGVYAAHHVGTFWLQLLFIALLFYVATQALLSKITPDSVQDSLSLQNTIPCALNPITAKLFWTASCTKKLLLTGSIAGFISGLLGVGGGFIVMPVLQKLSNLEHRMVVATSLAMTTLIALVSVISYAGFVTVKWHVAVPFVIATVIGTLFVKLKAVNVTVAQSRLMFGIISLLISIAMAVQLAYEAINFN